MLMSQELRDRIESDKDFAQKCSREILRSMLNEFKVSTEEIIQYLDIEGSEFLDWLSGAKSPGYFYVGQIMRLAAKMFVPSEWVIRGKVLDQYNPEALVPVVRKFIETAQTRLTDQKASEINLLIPKGTFTFFGLTSRPGYFRIWTCIRLHDDNLLFDFSRIGEEDEAIAGNFSEKLPTNPNLVTKSTITRYIGDHTFIPEDFINWTKWITEAPEVDSEYFNRAIDKGLAKDFRLR